MNYKLPSILIALVLVSVAAIAQNHSIDALNRNNAIQAIDVVKPHSSNDHDGHNHLPGEKCLKVSKMESLLNGNPEMQAARASAKEMSRRIMNELETGLRAAPPVYTIPVVFHVIHKGENVGSGTNISDAQLTSAIDALNRDYRRTSADGGIAQGAGPDTEIQFCLASVDPSGNPHSGINRVNGTGVSGYSGSGITSSNEGQVKALSRWDNRYYLNIWVVSEIDGNGADVSNPANFSGGTLGYAYLPVNPVNANSNLDGIVALNLCVGNDPNGSNGYRLWPWGSLTNRTLTHEVGHFLGLNHPFDNTFSCSESNCNTQGDQICDTPVTLNGSSCNNGTCPNTQVENYMDYTSESCQDQFTPNQTSYMRSVLSGVRNALVNTSNCSVSSNDYDAGISAILAPSGSLCSTTFTPQVTLTNYGSTTLSSVQVAYAVDGQAQTPYNWTGSLASGASISFTLPPVTSTAGSHTFTSNTVSGTLNGSQNDEDNTNNQSTSNFTIGTGGTAVTLTIVLDCWGEETTWEVRNASNSVVASGGPYTNNLPDGAGTITESICLDEGCYDFTIFDSAEDGLYGSQWSTCDVDGDYSITDGNTTLLSMAANQGDFGASETQNFCIGNGGGGTPDCEILVSNDGEGFLVNATDLPSFDVQAIDNDGEAVATTLANLGFTSNWMLFYEEVAPLDTNYFFGITSWHDDAQAPADNWFTFGPVTMLSGDGEFRWKHEYANNTYRDGYEVLVNTSGTDISDFAGATTLFSVVDNAASTDGDTVWVQQTVQLPAGNYAGQSLYFAFHHTALDQLFLNLDDIEVEGCTSLTVGIDEESDLDLKVFPNPSNGNFNFSYRLQESEDLNFELFNSMGQRVWQRTISDRMSGIETIETSRLSGGVYTLTVSSNKLLRSERLILTK